MYVMVDVLKRRPCESMKVKPGLWWKPQVVGDARAVRHLSRRAIQTAQQPKRKMYVADNKAGGILKSQLWVWRDLMIALIGLHSCFCPLFSSPGFCFLFWNNNVYSLQLCVM